MCVQIPFTLNERADLFTSSSKRMIGMIELLLLQRMIESTPNAISASSSEPTNNKIYNSKQRHT